MRREKNEGKNEEGKKMRGKYEEMGKNEGKI